MSGHKASIYVRDDVGELLAALVDQLALSRSQVIADALCCYAAVHGLRLVPARVEKIDDQLELARADAAEAATLAERWPGEQSWNPS